MTDIIDVVPEVPVDDELGTIDCTACGSTMDEDDAIMCKESEELYCIDCVNTCDDCNEYYYPDTNNHYYSDYCADCHEHYFMCERCDDVRHNDYMCNIEDDYSWCDDCASSYAIYCENCGYYERTNRACSNSHLINDHSYRPNPLFKRTHDSMQDTSFFGVELEVESVGGSRDEGAEFIFKAFNGTSDPNEASVVYLKSDGSLNYGFEIVTHPMTFDYAMNKMDWSHLTRLSKMDYRSWDTSTCGLHIHTSRRGFKDKRHLWFFTQLINGHYAQCIKLAGRSSEQWSAFAGQKKEASDIVLGKKFSHNRYVAVNLCNTATIEIRMFRGSLNPDRVRMAIQFVRSCVEYTRDMTITKASLGGLDWQEYKQYVLNNSGLYPELIWYMNEKGV